MLATAKQHFDEDMQRAADLLIHAATLPASRLRDDILRGVWMMAVGACDAYFSDAYADLIARTLRAKDLQPAVNLPDRLNNLKVPAIAVIRDAGGWRWRMAARELIEDENVLSLNKIKQLFNHFFRKTHKILTQTTIESWILHTQAKTRLFGITKTAYRALNATDKAKARGDALDQFENCFEEIFQRRHDCIHNCDRPKIALQPITDSVAGKRVQDITFLVERCHDAFLAEFPEYLRMLGFSGVTRNRVGA
ncbi:MULTISPECIES: hypothetical protein [Pandoraea]|uniref:RiboL-PSP-HEPN domain-containing protein n=1 Tax=Pandoraea communis TaxID=2508297 RepID=A0A5E4XXV2_9BURK|nr:MULTISPECIES: hypothetical protein [Pandoraea]ALS66587.1 hypothetical protein AT395_17800 [Pandoraea apista]CFB61441.1 hypothetical protein LMG16407_01500 [Pandoraea apista]VVE41063.1 hypothetical protein PCO31110_04210 [Pandoraea communis]